MTNIQIFSNPEFGEVRITEHNGEIAFVAKDIMERLGYAQLTSIGLSIKHVPDEWKGRNRIMTPSGEQEMWVLTEQGLYFFLARSDKPLALPFQKWIAGEVLPAVRKTGRYSVSPLSGLELVVAGYTEAMKQIKSQQRTIEKQQKRIAEAAPKERFYDLVKYSNVLCHFQGLANVLFNNGIDIGRNRLIRDFRGAGDVQQCKALFTQKALNRHIGQNVQTGMFDHSGITQMSFRAFLNHRGICEVFDRYKLTQEQRDSVMQDLMAADEPLSAEAGSGTRDDGDNVTEVILPPFYCTKPTMA